MEISVAKKKIIGNCLNEIEKVKEQLMMLNRHLKNSGLSPLMDEEFNISNLIDDVLERVKPYLEKKGE